MINSVNGLPTHILLVHAVVVIVPLAALLVILSAVWPAANRRLGIITPIVALVALVLVPITTQAGEWLQERLSYRESNALIGAHASLGDELLPWAIGLFVVAVAVWIVPWLVTRDRGDHENDGRRKGSELLRAGWLRWVLAVLAVALGVVAVIMVVRIGESGSKAVWTGTVCADPVAVGGRCTATLGS